MKLTKEQEERLGKCATDQDGQPLTCYGCRNSLSYDKQDVLTHFPGTPVEWGCLNCIRNVDRRKSMKVMLAKNSGCEPTDEEINAALKNRAERTRLLKIESDLYATIDYATQKSWNDL